MYIWSLLLLQPRCAVMLCPNLRHNVSTSSPGRAATMGTCAWIVSYSYARSLKWSKVLSRLCLGCSFSTSAVTESQKTSYDNVNASTFTHLLRYHLIKQQMRTLLPPLKAPRRILYLQTPLGRAFLHLMQRRKNFDRPDLKDQDLAAREIFAAWTLISDAEALRASVSTR